MAVEPHPPKTPPTDNIDFHIVKKLQIRGSDYHHIVQNIINQHICWGELCFDILRKNAHWRDDMLEICPREFDLLLFLAQYEGRIVAKDHIRNRVWELGFDPGTNIVEYIFAGCVLNWENCTMRPSFLLCVIRAIASIFRNLPWVFGGFRELSCTIFAFAIKTDLDRAHILHAPQ